jgi:transposase InsO family protein
MQLELDEESRRYVVLTTHRGLYRVNRMLYGLSPAVAIFQSVIERILDGLQNVVAYLDDIIVSATTKDELDERLQRVMVRLRDNGLVLRPEKCTFFAEDIEYLGHRINKEGLRPSLKNVEAILKLPTPTDKQQLTAFLGMAQYYSSHIPDMSTLCAPLNDLRKPDVKFDWTPARQSAFEQLRAELASPHVLTHYRDDLPLAVSADASRYGLGAVLFHVFPDGTEKVVRYASRTLNKAERNYAQIEKEGLGIIFAVRRFRRFLEGRKFLLYTDHKPLLRIFAPDLSTPDTAAQRLLRWSLFLANFQYEIVFRTSSQHANADGLSRLPLPTDSSIEVPDAAEVSLIITESLAALPIDADLVRKRTRYDTLLKRVLSFVRTGWPDRCPDDTLAPFYQKRDSLIVHDDILMYNTRVVVPVDLRAQLLHELHETHQGMTRMKSLARQYFWWPSLDTQIEDVARRCADCALLQKEPQRAPLHSWDLPDGPWQRIHLDFAGPLYGFRWLIWVDAYSKFAGVIPMKTAVASELRTQLTQLFATFGLPKQVVSDNGPEFRSQDYIEFLQDNGVRRTTSAPYHPQTNGEAERFVETFKKAMKASESSDKSLHGRVQAFLFNYRNTPHATTGVTPAELLFGRKLRTRLDLLRPTLHDRVARKQAADAARYDQRTQDRAFADRDRVLVRWYTGAERWRSGTILRRTGPVSYEVQVGDEVLRRHVTQLRIDYTSLPNRSETQDEAILAERMERLRAEDHAPADRPDDRIDEPPDQHGPAQPSVTPSGPSDTLNSGPKKEPLGPSPPATSAAEAARPQRGPGRPPGARNRPPPAPQLEGPSEPRRSQRQVQAPTRFETEFSGLGSSKPSN